MKIGLASASFANPIFTNLWNLSRSISSTSPSKSPSIVTPVRQKTPPCPDGFAWDGKDYRVTEKLSEWTDFTRRGRMARNMRPAHAAVAAEHGSLGVGRFYFRVRVDTGQVFDLYYDRAHQRCG